MHFHPGDSEDSLIMYFGWYSGCASSSFIFIRSIHLFEEIHVTQSPENILAMQHHHADQLQFPKAESREAFPLGLPQHLIFNIVPELPPVSQNKIKKNFKHYFLSGHCNGWCAAIQRKWTSCVNWRDSMPFKEKEETLWEITSKSLGSAFIMFSRSSQSFTDLIIPALYGFLHWLADIEICSFLPFHTIKTLRTPVLLHLLA